MDLPELLALYDLEERIKAEWPGTVREVTDLVVRHRPVQSGEHRDNGFIAYSRLDKETADRAIGEQIDYFKALGLKVGWKLYEHDQPADLSVRLLAHGFKAAEPESIMALDLHEAPAALLEPVVVDVRRIHDPDELRVVQQVEEAVWGEDHSGLVAYLRDTLVQHPHKLSIYYALQDDEPASVAWLFIDDARPFASLWGGSTLPQHRKRGFYTALLAVRLQEAVQRGARFLTIDASPMSRPIAQRFGFRQITTACDYDWEPLS
jgi:GNAT superfamily N-acetyltransferase